MKNRFQSPEKKNGARTQNDDTRKEQCLVIVCNIRVCVCVCGIGHGGVEHGHPDWSPGVSARQAGDGGDGRPGEGSGRLAQLQLGRRPRAQSKCLGCRAKELHHRLCF